MKKIFIILIIILTPLTLFGQLNGLGTIGSPFNGTFGPGDNLTWSGTVYVDGDIIVDNEQLTISPGTTIVFTTPGADLIITGTGQLNANGTALSQITFTKGTGNSSWGHISFQNMTAGFTGASIINYCIVEYGQKNSSPSNIEGYGGGIHAAFTFLTISNSIVRNNYAGWGGGIFVNSNYAPSIVNCLISNNTAANAGGGLYFYQFTSSLIINCIIEKNKCLGTYGGGGVFLGEYTANIRFYNCVFASNISSVNLGHNILLFGNTFSGYKPAFYNTIVWGSNSNSIDYLYGQSSASDDFNYCAIQGYTSGYTSCINLSGTNGDPTGPNFYNVTPGSEDYQIIFNSPCRDAGTLAGASSTDILGKFRVGLPDIGAYEVQYSNWTGAINTDWTNQSNWEASLDPGSGSGDVVIPFLSGATPNYPVGAPIQDFTIGTGKTMILRPGAEATFGALTNSGTLRLESDVTGISSLILNSYSGNNADVQLYLPGGGLYPSYVWHYISSPFTNLSTAVFTGTTKDLARYDENLITTDQNTGWEAYDGYIYSTGLITGSGFSNLDLGQGYNHYLSSNHTYIISGIFNTGNVTDNLAYNLAGSTPDHPNAQGFNLLGNPFPSCLDWTQISGSLDPSISQAIYFNKSGGFASWSNGIGTNGGTGTIPPMQGFFVKAYAKNLSLFLPSSARVHSATQTRYKKGLEIIPLVRLKIEDPLNSDDAVVRFDDKATTGVDNAFDAYKFSKSGLSIWTSTGGVDFSINGLPFPAPGVEIPVSVNSTAAENLKISASQIDGLDNYNVTLTDNVNNITIDLKTNPSLSFNAPGGIVAGRFTLKVLTVTTVVPETTISDKPFNIYSSNGMVNIQTLNDIWNGKQGGIKILDMTGRVLTTEDNVEFSKDDLLQVSVRVATGIYMVEMRSGVMRYVGKVVIR
jgi:hypothetical protein